MKTATILNFTYLLNFIYRILYSYAIACICTKFGMFHSIPFIWKSVQGTIDTHSKQHIKTQKHRHRRNTHKRNKI